MFRRLAVLCLLGTAACQGPRLLPASEATGSARAPVRTAPVVRRPTATQRSARVWAGPPAPAPRRGKVQLRDADMAGVEAWLGSENRQWILGDVVDVFASKEFFSRVLTLNDKLGFVQRRDQRFGQDLLVTMTYIGLPGAESAESNPRVQIGTGLMVSARKVLRVRLAKTSDPRRPIQLRILAHGKAAQGRLQTVERRDDQLELGGYLRHDGRRWLWIPVGG